MVLFFGLLGAAAFAMEGDAALLVGNHDLDAVLEDDFFEGALVFTAQFGVHADGFADVAAIDVAEVDVQ